MCPIDGKRGVAYVHCIDGNDHVGIATHMLSYAWGYRAIDIVETLSAFCKGNKLDPKKTYIWTLDTLKMAHFHLPFHEIPQTLLR